MKHTVRLTAALAGCVALANSASAIVAYDPGSTGGPFLDPANIGMAFTPNQDIIVTDLGAYDYLGNGFTGTPEVGIFNEARTLLTSVVFPTGTVATLGDDSYRYLAVPELTLTAGQTYWISSVGWHVDELLVGTGGATTASQIIPYASGGPGAAGGWYIYGTPGVLERPSREYVYDVYLGPNFQFRLPTGGPPSGVPDASSTLALASLVVGGLTIARKRIR